VTVDELFAGAVRRFPGHRAVTCQNRSLTYAQLDRRVSALARTLVRSGVQPGEPVAIRLAPSLETLVAMLGVLRAGACYLPIDADLPEERVRYLLDDSGARIVIDAAFACDDDAVAALPAVRADDAAYMIYTSGTTGSPKGVVIEHRSLVNYVTWFRERYAVDESHAAALLTSYAYDLAYTTLWTTILSGGELHLLPRATCEDAAAIARYLRDHVITFIKVTPSLLGALVASPAFDRAHCASLRLIVTGGEHVRAGDIATLYARLPNVLVVNHYGPTETTIGVTTYPIERDRLAEFAQRPVIGTPIGNVRAYVIDDELVIAGDAVGRGYHRRPELTRERFIPDPLVPGRTAYRTGDRARWTADGTLELLGRIDRQVKIRGYRVELSEIEQVMQRRLGLSEVVAVANRTLCAYYVGEARDPAELRASLAQVLPAYMVPAHFIPLAALPRTPNGKLDASALPEPQLAAAEDMPATETEHVLAALWADVLDVDASALGASQSFFELGGHSLTMIQLIAAIEDRFGRTVEIAAFYREGTIRGLARLLDGAAP